MSLSSALSVALTGLQTSTTAVQVISGNISNAQTEGYTRKSVSTAAITNGTFIGGVEITSYNRVTNSVLAATLNGATGTASYLGTQNNYLSQIQSILDSTSNPPALAKNLSAFQSAWIEFSANPSDSTLNKSVISSGQALASTINSISRQITTLESNVKNDLETSVTTVNTILDRLQQLNIQIATAKTSGQPTTNLEDERDIAINELSKYTNVTVMERNNGQVALYTPSGTALLDGVTLKFSVGPNGNTVVNAVGSDVSSSLSGGILQAQTEFLSDTPTSANGSGVIEKLKSQLQNFTNMFIATTADGNSFADVYDAAVTGPNELAASFFVASIDANGLPDLTTFGVNPNLIDGTNTVKASAAVGINEAFAATDIAITTTFDPMSSTYIYSTSSTFSSTGLTTQSQTYASISTSILSGFQQAANAIKTQFATASTQQAYYASSLSSQTGINTDVELVNLSYWQNSYAASAHVISTIQSMMKILENMVN